MLENGFQAKLIKEIKAAFPGCYVLKNDANYIQGFPDLTILFSNGSWAVLECKKGRNETHQPNQDHYVGALDAMSYSRFIYPENREQVLSELRELFL